MKRPTSELHRSVRVSIRGRVQGVGFRYFVRRYAQLGGIVGWVRNQGDGSVELEASGTQQDISTFIAQVEQGPDTSRVDGTEITNLRTGRVWDSFEITPTNW